MSTVPPLFRGLIDDAAVFPPGSAPLPRAVADHVARRGLWYAACVGPLLVPGAAAPESADLIAASGAATDDPVTVVVITRPGTDPTLAGQGVTALRMQPLARVAGLEIGWQPGWAHLDLPDLPLALEVPRGPDQPVAMAGLTAARERGRVVVAKFRTGATPSWAWPDEEELAAFLHTAITLALPVKLTGGLHHLVRADHPGRSGPTGGTGPVGGTDPGGGTDPQHGLLNVLLAVACALDGGSERAVAAVLADRESERLVAAVRAFDAATTRAVRATFTAYGCCTVTDPIGELVTTDLLTED